MSLRIEVWNKKADHQFIEYETFLVYSENDQFKLDLSKSTRGTLTDWLYTFHNGLPFYTKDHDTQAKNAHFNKGGWWFAPVNKVCLTCTKEVSETWASIGNESANSSLIYHFAKMMIKPIDKN